MNPNGVPEVAIKGISWGGLGSWATFLAVIGAVGLFVRNVGLTKIIELYFNRDKEIRGEKVAEDTGLLARVTALEERAQKAETVSMYLTGATSLLLNALRAVDPSNTAINQADSLVEMAVAAGGDSTFAKGLAKLAATKGTGP